MFPVFVQMNTRFSGNDKDWPTWLQITFVVGFLICFCGFGLVFAGFILDEWIRSSYEYQEYVVRSRNYEWMVPVGLLVVMFGTIIVALGTLTNVIKSIVKENKAGQ